jgi:uroporphyrinogen-III synthase
MTEGFGGRVVLAFESRRAAEMKTLIETFGGRPVVAPAVREVVPDADEGARELATRIAAGDADVVIFLTGVGVRAVVEAAERLSLREAMIQSLNRIRVIARGPKPMAALRAIGIAVWLNAPEPNTWRELISALAATGADLTRQRVLVQESGVPNPDLVEALKARGATVSAIRAYDWALPEDLGPLEHAADALARGDIDVMLVTSGVQFAHFWSIVRQRGLEAPARQALGHVLVASIGPSATAELRRHAIEPAFEPTHPKMGYLVREAAGRPGA